MKYTLMFCFAFLLTQASFAGTNHDHKPVSSKEFDQLKTLVGTWKGTTTMEGKEVPVTVTYTLTSNNTAITEKLFEGSEHEMVSVYSLNNTSKKVGMKHFCGMGNQPELDLKSMDPKKMSFEMTKPLGVSSMKEPHMHAMTLTWLDTNKIQQDWVSFENGKKKETATFNFTRKN